MIVQETLIHDGTEFIKTYSDEGYTIRQIETGDIYGEAIDLVQYPKEYEETDEKIEQDTDEQPEPEELEDSNEEPQIEVEE